MRRVEEVSGSGQLILKRTVYSDEENRASIGQ